MTLKLPILLANPHLELVVFVSWIGRPLLVVFVLQGWNLILYHIIASTHISVCSSVVSLIEVACVIILCSKLLFLPQFDLYSGFLLRKHILLILLSACEFVIFVIWRQLLLAAQILLEFIWLNNLRSVCLCVFVSFNVQLLLPRERGDISMKAKTPMSPTIIFTERDGAGASKTAISFLCTKKNNYMHCKRKFKSLLKTHYFREAYGLS